MSLLEVITVQLFYWLFFNFVMLCFRHWIVLYVELKSCILYPGLRPFELNGLSFIHAYSLINPNTSDKYYFLVIIKIELLPAAWYFSSSETWNIRSFVISWKEAHCKSNFCTQLFIEISHKSNFKQYFLLGNGKQN